MTFERVYSRETLRNEVILKRLGAGTVYGTKTDLFFLLSGLTLIKTDYTVCLSCAQVLRDV